MPTEKVIPEIELRNYKKIIKLMFGCDSIPKVEKIKNTRPYTYKFTCLYEEEEHCRKEVIEFTAKELEELEEEFLEQQQRFGAEDATQQAVYDAACSEFDLRLEDIQFVKYDMYLKEFIFSIYGESYNFTTEAIEQFKNGNFNSFPRDEDSEVDSRSRRDSRADSYSESESESESESDSDSDSSSKPYSDCEFSEEETKYDDRGANHRSIPRR